MTTKPSGPLDKDHPDAFHEWLARADRAAAEEGDDSDAVVERGSANHPSDAAEAAQGSAAAAAPAETGGADVGLVDHADADGASDDETELDGWDVGHRSAHDASDVPGAHDASGVPDAPDAHGVSDVPDAHGVSDVPDARGDDDGPATSDTLDPSSGHGSAVLDVSAAGDVKDEADVDEAADADEDGADDATRQISALPDDALPSAAGDATSDATPRLVDVRVEPGEGFVVWVPPLLGWLRAEPADGATPEDLVDIVDRGSSHPLVGHVELADRLARGDVDGGFVAVAGARVVALVAGDARVALDRGAGARSLPGPGRRRCDLLLTGGAGRVRIGAATDEEPAAGIDEPGIYAGGGVVVAFTRRSPADDAVPGDHAVPADDAVRGDAAVLGDHAALGDLIGAVGSDRGSRAEVGVARPEIDGVVCRREHFNDPRAERCAVCGSALDDAPRDRRPRPSLGALVVDDGAMHPLDRDYVIGRAPVQDARVRDERLAALAIADPDRLAGRVHAEIRLWDWDVQVRDLGSRNGTAVRRGGEQLPVGDADPLTLRPGDEIIVGGRTLTYASHHRTR